MNQNEFDEMTPAQFVERQNAGELWQLLDVREAWEIEIASVDGSVNIPMGQLAQRVGEIDLKAPVAVLCHGGVRSAHVARWLKFSGAVSVANIVGGIDQWATMVDSTIARY